MQKEEIKKDLEEIKTLLKKQDDHVYQQTSKPLNFKEACTYLGYAASYLYKLTSARKIPHYKPSGKLLFFSKAELDDWVFGRYGNSNCELRIENTSAPLSAGEKSETGNVKKSKRNGGKK